MTEIPDKGSRGPQPIPISLLPWLSVEDSSLALEYYQAAFGARVVYRLEDPEGALVLRLSIEGAEFWLSGGPPGSLTTDSGKGQEGQVRMILTVPDPDTVFRQALQAGATLVFPVGEDYGWRLGRLCDPFGIHWEIGRPLGKEL